MMGMGYSCEIVQGKLTAGVGLNILSVAFCFSLDSGNSGYIYTDPESFLIILDAKNLQYNISGYEKSFTFTVLHISLEIKI